MTKKRTDGQKNKKVVFFTICVMHHHIIEHIRKPMTTVKKTEHQVKEAKTLNNQEYKMGPANGDFITPQLSP